MVINDIVVDVIRGIVDIKEYCEFVITSVQMEIRNRIAVKPVMTQCML